MADGNLLLMQMQGVRAFIVYKLVPQPNGDLDKIPLNPITNRAVDPHDPTEWMLPEEAALWAEQLGPPHGVGVVISEQITLSNGLRLFCVDLDKCRDGAAWMAHAVNFCTRFPDALVERSVSGNGLHIFASYRGERPDHGVKNKTYRMECYTRLRFIAITGEGAQGSALVDHTIALRRFTDEFFPPHDDVEYGDVLTECPVPDWAGPDDDDELIRRAMRSHSAGAVFGGKAAFADLWNANSAILPRVFPSYKNTAWDESAADLALANHLAFWTGNHGVRVERIMRRSMLVRGKWERPGYLVGTINRACGSQKQFYCDPLIKRLQSATGSRMTDSATADGKEPRIAPESVQPASAISSAPVAQTATLHTTGPSVSTDGVTGAALLSGGVLANNSEQGTALPGPLGRPPVGDYLTLQQQLGLFDGCVYVQDVHEVLMPAGHLLSSERFDAEFSGYQFAVTADGQRPAKRAWEAFVHSEVHSFPKVKGTSFDPRSPSREITLRDGWTYINSFVPITIEREPGDASPFVEHMRRILPVGQDADILLAYFAACVQYPGFKFQWWPLIQGVEGNGKTILSELLEASVSSRYTHWPKAAEVGSKFNAAYYGKLLILVEDVKISEARDSLWETLKPMITGRKLEIQAKGIDQVTREVCFNGVLNSNHKNGIRKTRNDRRIGPFFCAQQHVNDLERDGLTEEYFNALRRWIASGGTRIVADFLYRYPIPELWNPATRAIRAPKTSATEDAINAGLGAVEQEVQEAIEQGVPGFRGGWVSSTALDRLLGVLGKAATIPRNKRRELLEAIGYSPHPGLPDGRSSVEDTDGSRPRLYVRSDAPGAREQNTAAIMQWYRYAQQ